MPADDLGRLRIHATRGGTIGEITGFLNDLEAAYLALYEFDTMARRARSVRDGFPPFELALIELGFIYPWRPVPSLALESVVPVNRLTLERVRIESPGFWEFLAALNPLQQLREYLNDRHKRRQDKDYREMAERERLELENEVIRGTIFKDRIAMLREAGGTEAQILQVTWAFVGPPLARLGRYQDLRMIEGAQIIGNVEEHAGE